MALYSNVLRRKRSPMQTDMANLQQVDGAQPGPKPINMAPGGPAPLVQPPRIPGNVAPMNPPPAARAVTPGAGMGIDPRPKPAPALPPKPAPPAVAETAAPGAQNAGAPAAPASQDDIDQMIRDLVAGQLSGAGKADTAEEEALIRQRMQTELGGSLVNQRARAGRAGFGASGALMAQEGDIKRAAEMDALDQVLGLRRTEDQRSIDNAMGAIGAEQGMRSAASADELRKMALQALQAEMGLDAGPGPTDVGNAPGGGTVIEPADANKDGTTSVQEQERYDQGTTEPYMAGSQKASEFFNGGGDASSLPSQPPGGDVIVLRQPRVDVDGNERPGVTYNTKTGALGRF